jgi:hypothetical protein
MAVATLAELAIPDTSASGVGGAALAAIDRIHPNPFRANTTIGLAAAGRTDLDVGVYTVDGRLIRRLSEGRAAPGRHYLSWDGRNEAGLPASPGVYFVKATTGGQEASAKVVLIR